MTTAKHDYRTQHDVATLERPNYAAGQLLEADDLSAAVKYTRDMMRLMFRSLFGCGVICGFDLTAQLTCNRSRVDVTIAKGVALDCLGDPIEVPRGTKIAWDADCDPVPEWLWVVVCYRETCCRPKDISCAADDEGRKVPTRIMDGYEVRLYSKQPKCVCSCEPPKPGDKRTPGDCCDDEEEADDMSQAGTGTAAATGKDTGYVVDPRPGTNIARPRQDPWLEHLCDCYVDHYKGKCDCTCCCPCVLIGKVHTTKTPDDKDIDPKKTDPQDLKIDRDWVRWIRPMLVGYVKCVKEAGRIIRNVDDVDRMKMKTTLDAEFNSPV